MRGEWRVESGEWRVESGEWRVESGEWRVESGEVRVESSRGRTSFRFERLDVWHRAVEYADLIYRITRTFPDDERFGLISQMRRAAVSVSSNVAEGSSRSSGKDFARFVEIAYGSMMEVVSQAHIAHRQSYLTRDELEGVAEKADELARMLSGLKRSLTKE